MVPQKSPIHINAPKGDIAEIVLFPGDPLRAKYIAENFLDKYKEVTNLRGMLGFTGYYKGKRITVMGSGMGMPSSGIYAFELFYFYNVQKIIRIGTGGSTNKDVKIPDIILADKVYSESNYAYSYNGYEEHVVIPSMNLVNNIYEKAQEKGIKVHKGTIMTIDVFGPYVDNEALMQRVPDGLNILGEEMEAYGIIHIANTFNREAACILTCVDSMYDSKIVSKEERETSLNTMIELALDSLV